MVLEITAKTLKSDMPVGEVLEHDCLYMAAIEICDVGDALAKRVLQKQGPIGAGMTGKDDEITLEDGRGFSACQTVILEREFELALCGLLVVEASEEHGLELCPVGCE